MLKLQALTYTERHGRTGRIIWNYATGTLTHPKGPDTMLHGIALSISTVEKCAPLQVEHGKASTIKEQKWNKRRTKGTKDEL